MKLSGVGFTLLFCCTAMHSAWAHTMAGNAPPELQHFGQLVGQWSTTEEGLKPDGSGWTPSKGADWDFYWAFDGWVIRDVYISPPHSEAVEDESKRQRGVNLRIYNPEAKQWVMTWLTPALKKPSSFTAVSTKEQIVMLSVEPAANGNYSRITLFLFDRYSIRMEAGVVKR